MRFLKNLVIPAILAGTVVAVSFLYTPQSEPPYEDSVPIVDGEYRGPTVRGIVLQSIEDGVSPASDLEAFED